MSLQITFEKTMGGGSSSQKDVSKNIHFVSLSGLKKFGSLPRFPDQKQLTITLQELSEVEKYNQSLIVFVSHLWLRSSKDCNGWNGKPHPDTPNNDQFKLIVEGVEKIISSMTKRSFKECYLWIDYCCLDQTQYPSDQIKQPHMLSIIFSYCDFVLSPIYDPDYSSWDWPSLAPKKDLLNFYQSPAWVNPTLSNRLEMKDTQTAPQVKEEKEQDPSHSEDKNTNKHPPPLPATTTTTTAAVTTKEEEIKPHPLPSLSLPPRAYLSRGWCRLELFANLLIPSHPINSSPETEERKSHFLGPLAYTKKQSKRPHFLYGTKEQQDKRLPVLIPLLASDHNLLQSSIFQLLQPSQGQVSLQRDIKIIQSIWEEILKAMQFLEEQQQVPISSQPPLAIQSQSQQSLPQLPNQHHPSFPVTSSSHNKHHNLPSHTISPSSHPSYLLHHPMPIEGIHSYSFSNGDLYEGSFLQGQPHGQGKYFFAQTGDTYEGEISWSLPHGQGIYSLHNNNNDGLGGRYEGSFVRGLMEGPGRYDYPTGSSYEGSFVQGLMQGTGRYTYSHDQTVYEGDFHQNQRHGKGKLYYANGDVYEGQFERDAKVGEGIYHEITGAVYRQCWKDQQLIEEKRIDLTEGNLLMMEPSLDDYDVVFIL